MLLVVLVIPSSLTSLVNGLARFARWSCLSFGSCAFSRVFGSPAPLLLGPSGRPQQPPATRQPECARCKFLAACCPNRAATPVESKAEKELANTTRSRKGNNLKPKQFVTVGKHGWNRTENTAETLQLVAQHLTELDLEISELRTKVGTSPEESAEETAMLEDHESINTAVPRMATAENT